MLTPKEFTKIRVEAYLRGALTGAILGSAITLLTNYLLK